MIELAWAAGFFDGEGSTFIKHTRRHKGGTTGKMYPLLTVECSVAQCRREPLDRFIKAVGVGCVRGPYKPRKDGHNPYFRWNTAGRPSVGLVLERLWPFLSEPKREQAKKCWGYMREKATVKSPKLKDLPL